MPAPSHGSNWLRDAVVAVMKNYEAGKVKLPEGKKLTPAAIAKFIGENKKIGGEPVKTPSTGAVSAVFDRLVEYELIVTTDKPRAFQKFTAKGKKTSVEEAVLARREARKAAHAAAKPAKATKPSGGKVAKKAAAKKAPAKKAAAKKTTAKKTAAKKATASA